MSVNKRTTPKQSKQTDSYFSRFWFMKQLESIMPRYFYSEEPTCSKNIKSEKGKSRKIGTCKSGPSKSSKDDYSTDEESESKQEIERLKTEVERLLCENSMLRKEIDKLNGERDGASYSKSESGRSLFHDVDC